MEPEILAASVAADGCAVVLVGTGPIVIGWRWLGEHDESEAGLDTRTGQRRPDSAGSPVDAERVDFDRMRLRVTWTDGRRTEHLATTLDTVVRDRRSIPESAATAPRIEAVGVELWASPPAELPPVLAHDAVVEDDDTLVELLGRMRRWGWAQLDGVPEGPEAIDSLAARIGYVRQTVFGGIWELAADVTGHADTAYGYTFLGPHTDGTYSHDQPGVQVFACQEKAGEGGDSILVDGFSAAADLVATNRAAAALLASVDVPCRYVEPGVSLRAERPVLRCDQSGRLVQVSLNAYDREPFLLADDEQWERFADAYDGFGRIVADEARWLRLGWQPGRLLMFDNWRVLHGRGAYTGSRRFLGCYLNHEDLESAWRTRGI